MNSPCPSRLTMTFAIALILALPASAVGQIRVLISGGFRAAYQEPLPKFENTTGITVTTAGGSIAGRWT
jgi:molybdate transport system substrate-binding protein